MILLIFFSGCIGILAHAPKLEIDSKSWSNLRTIKPVYRLKNKDIRIINLYQTQAIILYELSGHNKEGIVNRLVKDVYEPNGDFWNAYLGNKTHFKRWIKSDLLNNSHPIYRSLNDVLKIDFYSIFKTIFDEVEAFSNQTPVGIWYIVFGPGYTNMGGLGDGRMIIDLSNMSLSPDDIEFLLPHEINHQIYDDKPFDPDKETVLYRIINEGFASYFNYLFWKERHSQARALSYSDMEWLWCLENENDIFRKAEKHLYSRDRIDINKFASRQEKLINEGPTAIGYFIGFRICQAYVAGHGENSWKDIYQLPVREVLQLSGYLTSTQTTY